MSKKLENLIYKMLTTNTGRSICDSGGVGGRNHERNAKLSLNDFKSRPECTLELTRDERTGEIYPDVTIDVFHYLNSSLSLDNVCNRFNSRKVSNWDSKEFYGVSDKGEEFLKMYFECKEDSFNTYNYGSNFSQVMQGRELIHLDTGDRYILLQIHGGADIRGGYTNARLFKLEAEYFLIENCVFDSVSWSRELINGDGSSATREDLEAILGTNDTITMKGDLYD